MKAVALFYILIFFPPQGGMVVLPFGYETERKCQKEADRMAKFSEENGQGLPTWGCKPSKRAMTFETYMRRKK